MASVAKMPELRPNSHQFVGFVGRVENYSSLVVQTDYATPEKVEIGKKFRS